MARILVGMSGGVDSSVAALLLQRAGHDVVGLTALLFGETSAAGPCCGKEGAGSAKCVCDILGIEHHWIDMAELFERRVIGRFLDEYSAGRTPNPCSDCNRFIKFDAFFDYADQLGCEAVATGHYARLVPAGAEQCSAHFPEGNAGGRSTAPPLLRRAADSNKDQSYFLACIPPAKLARLHFPLGDYTKPQVRELARAAGLPTADRKESMDVCFMANRTGISELLGWHQGRTPQPGNIVDGAGRVLGRHQGIEHYTVGQRRGLHLGGGTEGLVVRRLDAGSNTVILGPAGEARLCGLELASFVNLAPASWQPGALLDIQCRFRQQSLWPGRVQYGPATAAADGSPDAQARIDFAIPIPNLAPGQWAVAYAGETVLCAGIIAKTLPVISESAATEVRPVSV